MDPERIAIAGCSYGGIQTIRALEAGADGKASFRAAVDFAGGAQTWIGTSVQDGHGGFCGRGNAVWGRDVLSFLETALKN